MEVETKTIVNPTDSLTDGAISTIVYEKEPEAATGDLEVEMAKEPAKLPTIVTNLDICFMLDCTGSMQSYIDRSRNKIKDIIEEVKQQYPESEIQVGIVGYRDVQDLKRFEILPFTSNIHSAKDFLDAIRADGGGDTPEDVNGAFQETLNKMEWQGQAKMIVHIADAPCHGKDFHSCWSDNHPSGYKDDVAWEVLFKKIVDERIDYLFLKIQSDTDKMFTKFKEIAEGLGAAANGVLFKQEPISIADATKTAPVAVPMTTTSLFSSTVLVPEKKKSASKKEKKETTKTKKTRETRSKSRKESVSRSRSKSVKTTKKEKAGRKKAEKEEEVSSDWNAPTHWTRSKYQEYLEHGGKSQKKGGYWTIPQTDATEIKTTRRRSSKKSTTRKPSVSKERSEKRDKKRAEKSTRRKASVSKDKERSAERTKKKNSTRSKSKKGGMAVEDTLPKRAFVAPKSKILTKAPVPVMPMPTSFVGMSAMDEQEYFAKLLSKEMMESIHRKKDAVK